MGKRADGADYEVGYGKPPKHSQFKKNQSGNPRGRPKGARGLKAELEAELNEFATISVNGKSKRVRKSRLILMALTAKAAKGNVAAADKLLSLMVQAFGFEEERPEHKPLSDTEQLMLEQFLRGSATPPLQVTLVDPAEGKGDKR